MTKKMNKKAWIRIFESVISLLIILLALIFFTSQQVNKVKASEEVNEILSLLAEKIEKNSTLKEYIINEDINISKNYIGFFLENNYAKYNFSVCAAEIGSICKPDDLPQKKEVLSRSVFLSKYDEQGNEVKTKKVIIYLWKK